jgi:transcription factor WhiB
MDVDWRQRAACRELWDLFHPDGTPGTVEQASRATHICLSHCPVFEACDVQRRSRRDWRQTVIAGVHYNADGERRRRPGLRRGCPYCERS